jgi:hypothetical protein
MNKSYFAKAVCDRLSDKVNSRITTLTLNKKIGDVGMLVLPPWAMSKLRRFRDYLKTGAFEDAYELRIYLLRDLKALKEKYPDLEDQIFDAEVLTFLRVVLPEITGSLIDPLRYTEGLE